MYHLSNNFFLLRILFYFNEGSAAVTAAAMTALFFFFFCQNPLLRSLCSYLGPPAFEKGKKKRNDGPCQINMSRSHWLLAFLVASNRRESNCTKDNIKKAPFFFSGFGHTRGFARKKIPSL